MGCNPTSHNPDVPRSGTDLVFAKRLAPPGTVLAASSRRVRGAGAGLAQVLNFMIVLPELSDVTLKLLVT